MRVPRIAPLLLALLLLAACAPAPSAPPPDPYAKNFYEIFVGSFRDSDGDGVGDLPGILSKLDYLEKDLGVNALWLTPFMPSPSYHKYDVTDYYAVDPQFGTMADFERLVAECEARGIAVVIDLVLNHSSSEHPWFTAAAAGDARYRDYYCFSDTQDGIYRYQAAPGLYYEAGFWSGMPDFNMDCEELRDEILRIAQFWLDKGVSGFRLDAAKHIYSDPDKNYAFWTWFSAAVKEMKGDAFLVAEVWDGENVILPYYATGLTALFAFSFAGETGSIHSAVRNADGAALASNIERYYKHIRSRSPDAVNAPFLSNHDTDRSASYIAGPDWPKLEAAIYLLLPGSPFLYYGEEIGMTGRGADENKRAPMDWPEVDTQLADPDSLLNYYRAVLALKARHPDILSAGPAALDVQDDAVCALRLGSVAVLHNLSGTDVELTIDSLGGLSLSGSLSPSGAAAEARDGVLVLPPYGTAVLSPGD